MPDPNGQARFGALTLILLSVLLMAGCATYQPSPLDSCEQAADGGFYLYKQGKSPQGTGFQCDVLSNRIEERTG